MNGIPQVQISRRIGRDVLRCEGYLTAHPEKSHEAGDEAEVEFRQQRRTGIQDRENIILVVLEESGGAVSGDQRPLVLPEGSDTGTVRDKTPSQA